MIGFVLQHGDLHPGPWCEDCQALPVVRDRFWARQLLSSCKNDVFAMTAIRSAVLRNGPGRRLTTLSHDAALDEMASLLSVGAWHVHITHTAADQRLIADHSTYSESSAGETRETDLDSSSLADSTTDSSSTHANPDPAFMLPLGDYGQRQQVAPTAPLEEEIPHWIEIELIGEDGNPISGERYTIELPDGQMIEGSLDPSGVVRVDGISEPGQCKICFPELDQDAWDRV